MANRVPFTAYFRIVPERGSGKRFEIQRSRERIAQLVWYDLNNVLENAMQSATTGTGTSAEMANFAVPGGTITWTLAADESSIGMSMPAVAVKPQFGEFPDAVTVVGFFERDVAVPYREKQLISSGRVWRGPAAGAPGYSSDTEPSDANRADVLAIKDALEAAITSVSVDMIKLEVSGVSYGRGGYHFPRS